MPTPSLITHLVAGGLIGLYNDSIATRSNATSSNFDGGTIAGTICASKAANAAKKQSRAEAKAVQKDFKDWQYKTKGTILLDARIKQHLKIRWKGIRRRSKACWQHPGSRQEGEENKEAERTPDKKEKWAKIQNRKDKARGLPRMWESKS